MALTSGNLASWAPKSFYVFPKVNRRLTWVFIDRYILIFIYMVQFLVDPNREHSLRRRDCRWSSDLIVCVVFISIWNYFYCVWEIEICNIIIYPDRVNSHDDIDKETFNLHRSYRSYGYGWGMSQCIPCTYVYKIIYPFSKRNVYLANLYYWKRLMESQRT